jgi:hypothetical protein
MFFRERKKEPANACLFLPFHWPCQTRARQSQPEIVARIRQFPDDLPERLRYIIIVAKIFGARDACNRQGAHIVHRLARTPHVTPVRALASCGAHAAEDCD